MRRLGLSLMITLMIGCAKPQPPPSPPPPPQVEAPAPQPANFAHRVEWRGQTLSQIARWYTGKSENWGKLASPVNPDLTRCCAMLAIGREVVIPRELLVRTEPMPKPKVTSRPAKPLVKSEPERPKAGAAPVAAAPSAEEDDTEEPPAAPIAEAP